MVQVKVTEGILEGELVNNEYGGQFCSFKGIPYAQPPIGDLRFKAPQPAKPWTGIRSAKEFGSECYQYDMFKMYPLRGSEDCLYLNVYTPELKPDKPLPVMVWIHGGGFMSGSGNDDLYGPEFLVRQGVILVTFNYRLEVLGFLCLDTEDVPGNAGMKDQVAALKWVNKNISRFGGDPDNVTIFGESAGGASVSHHLVSPMSKGLFKRAIAQSGVTTCSWAKTFKPYERALVLARQLGYESENEDGLYEFFKSQPLESLINVKSPISFSEQECACFQLYFGVVSEKKFGNNERFFFDRDSDNLDNYCIHDGVDVITGYTKDEGVLIYSFAELEKMIKQANNFSTYFTPKHIVENLPITEQIEAGKRIQNFYMSKKNGKLDWEKLASYYGFEMFIYPGLKWTKVAAKSNRNKIYLYRFNCKSERNMACKAMGLEHITGGKSLTSHVDDLFYLFNNKHGIRADINSEAFNLIENVTKLWTDFAKYGNPTPDGSLGVKWNPYSTENEEFLEIGNVLEAGTAPEGAEYKFWDDIFHKYLPKYDHRLFY